MRGDARDTATWSLFADWCQGTGRRALPAHPLDLAEFIEANPASLGTQRRRISVINRAHRSGAFPPPGNAALVGDLLDQRRFERRRRTSSRALKVLRRIEDGAGWESRLVARRDRMLLLLVAAGTRHAQVERMTCGDLAPAGDGRGSTSVRIDGHRIELSFELLEGVTSPREVLEDWLAVRAVQHAVPSTRATQALLEGRGLRGVGAPPDGLPLFTALDRWCAPPLDGGALSAAAIGVLVAHLLAGEPTRKARLPARVASPAPEEPAAQAHDEPAPALDPDAFRRGLEARRRGLDELENVTDILDGVEDRADALLANLARILGDDDGHR